MNMHESGEMYLETILRLSEKRKIVRSIDVAEAMGYSKPSISRAMKNLREDGYIEIDPITGSPETAEDDACRIEHVISEETFNALKKHIEKYGND